LKILALTRYKQKGASSRVRFHQSYDYLSLKADVISQSLFDDEYLVDLYDNKKRPLNKLLAYYIKRIIFLLTLKKNDCDVIWLQKELLPFCPAWLEHLFLRRFRVVADYDDATFHSYDNHKIWLVRFLYGSKIDQIMARSHTVVVGNSYLMARARKAGAKHIQFLPSVIDLDKYSCREYEGEKKTEFVIGWIGSPGSQRLLQLILPVMAQLAKTHNIVLRLVGATTIEYSNLNIEILPWSEEGEVEAIKSFDIGIMPVQDEPFQRGKCGFKLIQYMACAVPVVASPVGFNNDVVKDGINGFLASEPQDWIAAIEKLMDSIELRKKLGFNGRRMVESDFCFDAVKIKLLDILQKSVEIDKV